MVECKFGFPKCIFAKCGVAEWKSKRWVVHGVAVICICALIELAKLRRHTSRVHFAKINYGTSIWAFVFIFEHLSWESWRKTEKVEEKLKKLETYWERYGKLRKLWENWETWGKTEESWAKTEKLEEKLKNLRKNWETWEKTEKLEKNWKSCWKCEEKPESITHLPSYRRVDLRTDWHG